MSRCRLCRKPIQFIRSKANRPIAVNTDVVRADGKRMLVFSDGSVGKHHEKESWGYVVHNATCEVLKERRESSKRLKEVKQPRLVDTRGCLAGCVQGWIIEDRGGKSGVKPCPIHRSIA